MHHVCIKYTTYASIERNLNIFCIELYYINRYIYCVICTPIVDVFRWSKRLGRL